MEQHTALGDIIAELLDHGYTLDLHPQCPGDCPCITGTALPAGDFTIDAVYRCAGAGSPPETVYILAVSAPRYHLKGIVINVVIPETVNWARVFRNWCSHWLQRILKQKA